MTRLLLLLALAACTGQSDNVDDTDETTGQAPFASPHLLARAEDKALIAGRADREPYATLFADIRADCDTPMEDNTDPVWDHELHGRNAQRAESCAFLAWVFDDEAAAERAKGHFARFRTDFETNTNWDVNIRMISVLGSSTLAVDLLRATPWWSPADDADAAEKITTVAGKFYDEYAAPGSLQDVLLAPAQNNHPIRTAVALGTVTLLWPEAEGADAWANFAFSELSYLWGPNGQYVQPDGAVSEGPFYYDFAFAPSIQFFQMAEDGLRDGATFSWDCSNRQTVDPWQDHGCVEGAELLFENPLRTDAFLDTARWSLALRMPSGLRPPLEDANVNTFNGGAHVSTLTGDGAFRWDWETNAVRPYESGWGAHLAPFYAARFDDSVIAAEPSFTTRFYEVGGQAVFRSGWDEDARWILLTAEHGSARKTLHDHVDGTSFTLAAYGETLLIDPGYYKPSELANARTSGAQSHNLILIDGQGPPTKGLLTNFGDTDAFIEETHDGKALDYAEARSAWQDTTIVRSLLFVDGRYAIVADDLTTDRPEAREHRFRLHGHAGRESGGTFEIASGRASWIRAEAGVDAWLASPDEGLLWTEPPFEELMAPHVHQFDWDRAVGHHGVADGTITAKEPDFLAVIAPFEVGAGAEDESGRMTVEPVAAPAGVVAWHIVHEAAGVDDIALIRSDGAPETFSLEGWGEVHTDARFAFWRRDGSLAAISRGSALTVDDLARITAGQPSGATFSDP